MTATDGTLHHDETPGRGVLGDQWGVTADASFRKLVDTSPDGIVVHRDGRVVYANTTAVRWTGAQFDDQVRGQPVTAFIHQESIESVLTRMAALRSEGDATRASESVLLRLDGTTMNVEAVTALTTWEGEPAYHVTIRDLTFAHTAQRSLRYQAGLVDRVGVAVIATTVTGLVTLWNPTAEAMYRRSAADTLALPVSAAVGAPMDPAAIVELGGMMHAAHRTSDGHAIYVRVSAAALDTGFVLVCTDKTETHGVEGLSRSILDSLDEGVLVFDGAGDVVSVNPAAKHILGLPVAMLADDVARVLVNMPMYDTGRRRIPHRESPITRMVMTGQPFHGFVVGIDRAEGRRIWLRCAGRRLDGDHHHGRTTLVSFSDITDQWAAHERLTHRATHDALTGLPNRGAVLNHISDFLRAQGDQRLGAVLFIDLDNLKAINDSLGHDTGDELLQSVAHCLRASVGPNDVVGRLGGDEFVALVKGDVGVLQQVALVERLERNLAEPVALGAATLRSHASIGVTVVAPGDRRSAVEILRDADSAMYETKAAKRHRRIRQAPEPPAYRADDEGRSGGRHARRPSADDD